MKAMLLDLGYTIKGNKTYVKFILKDKEVFELLYEHYPYFYVACDMDKKELIEKVAGKTKEGKTVHPKKVEEAVMNINGEREKVLKVYCYNPPQVPLIKASIPFKCYEYKIPFVRRFMMDLELEPFSEIDYDEKDGVITKINSITPKDKPELSRLSFDIETYNPLGAPRMNVDPIIMISYKGKTRGVITYKKIDRDFVQTCKNEKEIIEEFNSIIKKENPDVICGYNSANFDIPYLEERADVLKTKLEMGRFGGALRKINRGMVNAIEVGGRSHLDLYPIMRFFGFTGIIKTQRYTLEAVYHAITKGKKKMVKRDAIWETWDKGNLEELADYSMMDADSTYEIGERVIPLYIELAKLIKLPLFDAALSTSGQMVESLLMNESTKKKIIIPGKPSEMTAKERAANPIEGAFVKNPFPGIYDNIVVMDFRSLYPSIIISYNVDPHSLTKESKNAHTSPLGTNFLKKPVGLIPSVLERLVDTRAEIKGKLKKAKKDSEEYTVLNARSQALKILANTFYGALGYARFRWYNRSCAEAVTAWGREHIKDTIKSAEDAGFEVIYGDSLPYGRYIFVKNPSGILDHIKIGDFVRKNKNNPNLNKFKTIAYDGSKLIFKPILRAIEHSYDSDKKGKLMEFVTNKGKTIVTPQHSVYYFNEKNKKIELIDAKNLRIGDKLISLTNPKLPEIYKNNHKIDILDLDLGNQKDELRVYADNLKFPYGKKGKCPYCGKERTLYSRISVEHSDRKISLEKAKKTNYGFIGGKNAKIGRIPRFWRLNEELAWIMGYYCADGSASEKNNVHNKQLVSFGSQNKKTIEKVRKYFDGILGEKLKIIKDFDKRINKNMYYYRIQRAPLVALFKYGFRLGNKSYGKRVSPLIFSAENKIKEEFLKGYLEGDGNKFVERRYRTHFIDISTKSHELAIGLQVLLKSMKHSKNYFGKKMEHIHWNYRKDKPGIVDLRLQGVRSKNEEFSNFCLAEIKKINKINEKDTVFDLEVEGLHNFVDAEGLILVHNTDSVFLLMGKRKKKDAEEFIEKINSKLPGKMELELEGYYPRGVFVDKKGGGTRGAKKKYALIAEDGSYKIKGFELVRRDWSKIAKDTQKKVLEAILKEGSKEKAAKIVKDVVEKLKKGKVPFEELVIYTQINKDPKSYDIKSPELSAAKKAIAKGVPIEKGSMIAFVIGKKGDSISDKATPLDFAKDYDADYYINRQILPSVMKILKELGYSEDDLKLGGKQKGLGEFF